MTKRYSKELQHKFTIIVIFFAIATAPLKCFMISLKTKILPIFIYLKKLALFETARRFMTHKNEHSKRVK